MKLRILSKNNALDESGGQTQGFDVADEKGHIAWLRPALRHQLENGRLDLEPGDVVLADDFICGGGNFPFLVAESIRKIGTSS